MEKMLEDKKDAYTFKMLYTKYGSLYLYTKYTKQEGKITSETREFFTNEIAVDHFGQMEFMGQEACFSKCVINWKDFSVENYVVPLSLDNFLCQVSPYLVDEEAKRTQILNVYNIFNQKIHEKLETDVIFDSDHFKEKMNTKEFVKH